MAPTTVTGTQIKDGTVSRADLNVSGTSGTTVVAKLIAGTNVTFSSTGTDAGTGDVTINANPALAGQNQIVIDDIRPNVNITEEVFGNFNAYTFPNTVDAKADFPLPIATQPTTDITINVIYVARGSTSGNLKLDLNYNLLDAGDDASTTTYANTLTTGSIALVSGDLNDFRVATFTITIATLNTATAPFQVMAQLQRDTSVGSNYGANISVIGVYAAGLPSAGGYTSGDLTVAGKIVNYSDSVPAANAAHKRTFKVTTTDATLTTIATIAVTDNCLGKFTAKVAAHYTSTSVDKNYWAAIDGSVRRRNAGSAALVGTTSFIEDTEGSPGYLSSVAVSGNNLLIQVTGASSETVVWTIVLDYQEAV